MLLRLLNAAVLGCAVALPPAYKNSALPVDQRVADLVSRMTTEEKVNQLLHLWVDKNASAIRETYGRTGVGATYVAPNFHYEPSCTTAQCHVQAQNDLQGYLMNNSRLGIPISYIQETLHGGAVGGTIFPMPCGIGATWNASLVHQIGSVIGLEARTYGADRAFSPELNVCTDPRFGRTEENFGEDPFLVSELGVAMALGMQGDAGGPSAYLPDKNHVVCEAKHYAAYGFGGKDGRPADISEMTLFDVYLRPWKAFVQRAGGRGVMASHNEVNGVPMHVNARLLHDVLRNTFGFGGGFVASDYNDVRLLEGFRVVHNDSEAAQRAVTAGVDQELGAYAFPSLVDAVSSGAVPIAAIDRAAGNILRAKFAAGLFDDPYTDPSRLANLDSPAHRQLARETAEQGTVLLKNVGVLPLDFKRFKSIAVLGPNAGCADPNDCGSVQGNQVGGYTNHGSKIVTFLDAAKALAPQGVQISFAQGCDINTPGLELIPAAVQAAKAADLAILVLGDSGGAGWAESTCGEDEDRPTLDLPGGQQQLLQAVLDTNTTTIVVLVHGRPATFGPQNALLDQIAAVLAAWRPGEEGGTAIWRLLAGYAEPSGRLAQAWPRSAGHIHSPANPWFQKWQGDFGDSSYALNDPSTPLFPFGFGLSYTNFTYANPSLSPAQISATGTFAVTVDVKNVGSRPGSSVVQVYFRQDYASYSRYERMLCGFAKVSVQPGSVVHASITVRSDDLGYYDPVQQKHVVEAGTYTVFVGQHSANTVQAGVVTVQ